MTATELQLPLPVDELRQTLKKYGVIHVQVFGSYARGDQTANSDLDLLIEGGPDFGFFDLMDLQAELEGRARVKVDVLTKIKKSFIPYIEPELVTITL
jgi:predicted nucleotidyltransferase